VLIARVAGDVSATQKHPSHEGQKLLLVQPLDLLMQPLGNAVVAVDGVGAGAGQLVLLVMDGYAANTTIGLSGEPVDMAVVGIIDHIAL
jgi:microcompartment protein CcmK/EutM